MNCAEAGERLSEYVCQDLTPEQRVEVEDHLGGCPACAEQVTQMRAVSTWLERQQTPLPAALSPVPLLVRQAGELRHQARRWRWRAAAAAAVAAAALVAITLVDHVQWKDNALIVDFGGGARRPGVAAVDARLNERIRRNETSIEVLQTGLTQLYDQQRELIASVDRAMQRTTALTDTGAANSLNPLDSSELWQSVGLDSEDY